MIYLLIWIGCGVICGFLAQSKHRSITGWVILGIIFGVFAVIVLLILPNANPATSGNLRKCPFCAEFVQWEAIVCRHCGRDLPVIDVPRWEWERKALAEQNRVAIPVEQSLKPEDLAGTGLQIGPLYIGSKGIWVVREDKEGSRH